ncbi:hypothetical protein [Billgrantia ethanolica]|uniref:Uncharacterized protein n=1 Tax=Billgrantia ethanolica TaxID=2733486 RepID=A0ABS9A6I3_9GAMM|nr:hypothetical protein [Halomonas ethanolica]MCE8004424.1 hypothetical protein [Halomonas ethanolica]
MSHIASCVSLSWISSNVDAAQVSAWQQDHHVWLATKPVTAALAETLEVVAIDDGRLSSAMTDGRYQIINPPEGAKRSCPAVNAPLAKQLPVLLNQAPTQQNVQKRLFFQKTLKLCMLRPIFVLTTKCKMMNVICYEPYCFPFKQRSSGESSTSCSD